MFAAKHPSGRDQTQSPKIFQKSFVGLTPRRVIEAIEHNLRCQPSSPPRGIIKPWHCSTIPRGLLAATDPHQCDLSHFRFSAEVTNRQKGEDFRSRRPSPISLT